MALIDCKGVSLGYEGNIVAKDLNFRVEKGDYLCIVGENGSGKTTLMNMLSGIYYPDSGQIFVDDKEVTISSPKDA